MAPLGKALAACGLILVLLGLALWGASLLPVLGRLGRLPGDIYVRRGNFTFYFPIATAVVVSVVLSLLLALMRR